MKLASEWKDYQILDMAEGQKLEKWGDVILSIPDPQIIWKDKSFTKKWKDINATYHRSKTGGGLSIQDYFQNKLLIGIG